MFLSRPPRTATNIVPPVGLNHLTELLDLPVEEKILQKIQQKTTMYRRTASGLASMLILALALVLTMRTALACRACGSHWGRQLREALKTGQWKLVD